jgi:hypothetical protein
MKKVRINFPKGFSTILPIHDGEIYPIDEYDAFDDTCYKIILPSGERYNVVDVWCIPIPEYEIELPEDLFDL